jgi:hypothetical protein
VDVDKGSVEDEGGPTHSNIDVIFALGPYAVVNAYARRSLTRRLDAADELCRAWIHRNEVYNTRNVAMTKSE